MQNPQSSRHRERNPIATGSEKPPPRRVDDRLVSNAPIRSLTPDDPDYPARLRDLRDPPERLWVRGSLPRAPAVAIVGTRRADRAAIDFTEQLARELAHAGVSIVSGGAVGIDAAAHRGALLADAHTLVVQAAPLAHPYPRANHALFARVLEQGGWLSETAPGIPPQPFRFLARNRLIAALADAVVVVQAPARSGALSTARFARTLARPLFAVPAAPWDPRSEGVLALLVDVARVCRSSGDLRAPLGLEPQASLSFEDDQLAIEELGPDAERVLGALSSRPAYIDEIVANAELSAARVQVALIELSVAGRARQESGAWRALR